MMVSLFSFVFFFKQKTAYEMRISDWSSDVCSSDLLLVAIDGRDIDVDGGQRVEIDRGEAGVLAPRADRAERQRVGQHGRHVHRQTIGLHILFRVVEADAGVVEIVEDRSPPEEVGAREGRTGETRERKGEERK